MIDYRPAGRGPFAIKLAEIQPTDRILNVGCYNGHLERHFFEANCKEYQGIDLNREAIEFAKTLSPHPENFQIASAEALPFEDDRFEKVFLLDVLEHVQDEKKTLSEIYRVLSPGGTLILSVPNDYMNFLDPDDLTRDLRNIYRKLRKRPLLNHPSHRHYSEAQLRILLEAFEIDQVHVSGTPLFWFFAMFYNGMAIPESITTPLRRTFSKLEDSEYALKLERGFNIMIRAKKSL